MAILRSNKPPIQADVTDFVWKKWFQDIGDLTRAGVVSPSSFTNTSSGVQGHLVPKNLVINGDFSVWQRGTSFTVPAVNSLYSADRWTGSRGGIVGMTMSRQTGPSGIPFCIRATRAVADTGTSDQTICYNFPAPEAAIAAGQTLTVSGYMRVGAGFAPGARMEVRVLSGTGTDENRLVGAFTGALPISLTYAIPVNTAWQRFSASFTLATTATEFCLLFSQRGITSTAAIANDYYEMTGIQCEIGSIATPFQVEPFAQTIQRCLRYYQKSFPYATAPAQGATATGAVNYTSQVGGAVRNYTIPIRLPVQMRIAPTLTFYNPNAANALWRNLTAAADSGAASSSNLSGDGINITNSQLAGDLVNQLFGIHYQADAEL